MGYRLICRNKSVVLIVQCKSQKNTVGVEIVRELMGSIKIYEDHNREERRPIMEAICTTSQFSPEAKKFSGELGIKLYDEFTIGFMPDRFEIIRCKNSEKLYYLPTDEGYDLIDFSLSKGDSYCMTVAEAEEAGFSRGKSFF